MSSDFRLEVLGSIPDATKDFLSSCGVCASKIHGSESPTVDQQQYTTGVVSGENLFPFSQIYMKIVEVEVDGDAIYGQEPENELLIL